MKTQHTKGEWHFRTGMSDNFCEIIGDYGTNKTIAVAPKDCFVAKEEAEANGRLMAAAPGLLEACAQLRQFIIDNMDVLPNSEEIRLIGLKAIVKATE